MSEIESGFFDLLSMVYQKDGFWPFIFLLFVIVFCIIIYKNCETIFKNLFLKRKRIEIKLSDHIIFSKLEALINHVVKSIHISCPLRNKVFKKVLIIRFEIMLKLLKETIIFPEDISSENLKIIWESFFAKLENTWYEEVVRVGVPRIVVQKYYDIRDDHNRLIAETAFSFCEKQGNVIENASFILDLINGMEVASLQITQKAIASLNGELSKIEFEGTKCEQCHDLNCIYKVVPVI